MQNDFFFKIVLFFVQSTWSLRKKNRSFEQLMFTRLVVALRITKFPEENSAKKWRKYCTEKYAVFGHVLQIKYCNFFLSPGRGPLAVYPSAPAGVAGGVLRRLGLVHRLPGGVQGVLQPEEEVDAIHHRQHHGPGEGGGFAI